MKNIIKYTLITLTVLLISGCGHSSFVMLDKDKNYKEALQYTKKKQLKNYLDTLAIFRATYLNLVYPNKYKDHEYFFIGVYIPNDIKKSTGLDNPLFLLTLNNQKPLKVTKLTPKKDALIKKMPLTNRWTNYYIVEFNSTKEQVLNITYTHLDTNNSISFKF